MTDDEFDAEALSRAREALVGDLDDATDDEIRKTTMYAIIRLNLAIRRFADEVVDAVKSALLRFTTGTDRPDDTA